MWTGPARRSSHVQRTNPLGLSFWVCALIASLLPLPSLHLLPNSYSSCPSLSVPLRWPCQTGQLQIAWHFTHLLAASSPNSKRAFKTINQNPLPSNHLQHPKSSRGAPLAQDWGPGLSHLSPNLIHSASSHQLTPGFSAFLRDLILSKTSTCFPAPATLELFCFPVYSSTAPTLCTHISGCLPLPLSPSLE